MLHPKIQHVTICLCILSFGVQSELICSDQPIVALDGDDVILPCHLQPPINVSSETILWIKPGLDPNYVHVHHDGRLVLQSQNPSYNFRTKLFVDELKNGNVSLKILKVKLSDEGKYVCILPSMRKKSSIQLTVGVVSRPVIEIVSKNDAEVVLHCKSEGWYPEPEVSWLYSEGHVLSVEPTETVRGPDGLYNVSSRVTMKRRNRKDFTCRVQQKNINQTRETQIHVPDDFSLPMWFITLTLLATILIVMIFCVMIEKHHRKLIHSCKELLKKDERNTQADSPELSRLTRPKTRRTGEPENNWRRWTECRPTDRVSEGGNNRLNTS